MAAHRNFKFGDESPGLGLKDNFQVLGASAKLELVDKFCYLGDMLSVD